MDFLKYSNGKVIRENHLIRDLILKIRFKTNMNNRIGKFYGLVTCTSVGVNQIKKSIFGKQSKSESQT